MIRTFKSEPLRAFWESSDGAKIAPRLQARIMRRLDALDQAVVPRDMNIPGFDFHGPSGSRGGTYTVQVNGPWCLTFRWDGADAIDVDLENYH